MSRCSASPEEARLPQKRAQMVAAAVESGKQNGSADSQCGSVDAGLGFGVDSQPRGGHGSDGLVGKGCSENRRWWPKVAVMLE